MEELVLNKDIEAVLLVQSVVSEGKFYFYPYTYGCLGLMDVQTGDNLAKIFIIPEKQIMITGCDGSNIRFADDLFQALKTAIEDIR